MKAEHFLFSLFRHPRQSLAGVHFSFLSSPQVVSGDPSEARSDGCPIKHVGNDGMDSPFADGIGCAKLEDQPTSIQDKGGVIMNGTTIGIDLAKNVFEVYVEDGSGAVVERKRLSRKKVLPWFANGGHAKWFSSVRRVVSGNTSERNRLTIKFS